jgi:hypothetical protein
MGYAGAEPAFGASPTDPASDPAATESPVAAPTVASSAPAITGGELVMRDLSGKANFVLLARGDTDQALALSRRLCTDPGTCRVMGWTDRAAIPAKLPITAAARESLQFSYTRDPAGTEITLYNCDTFKGLPREKCIPKGALPR